MEQPVTVRFRWSADDLIEVYLKNSRRRRRVVGCILLVAMISILAATFLWRCPEQECHDFWRGVIHQLLLFMAMFGGLWLIQGPWQCWLIRHRFAKRPKEALEIEWNIGSDMLAIRSEFARTELRWEAVPEVMCAPWGIMLYIRDDFFHYLPRRGFASDAEFEQVIALARSKASQFRIVS